jgi:hypothetical protein
LLLITNHEIQTFVNQQELHSPAARIPELQQQQLTSCKNFSSELAAAELDLHVAAVELEGQKAAAEVEGQDAAAEVEGHEAAAVVPVVGMNQVVLALVVLASVDMVDKGVGMACAVEACSHHMVDSMVDTDHGSTVVVQDSSVLSCLMAVLAQAVVSLACLQHPVTSLRHPSSGDPWKGKESALLLVALEC